MAMNSVHPFLLVTLLATLHLTACAGAKRAAPKNAKGASAGDCTKLQPPCDKNAEKRDNAQKQVGYECLCNDGYTGNGFLCYRPCANDTDAPGCSSKGMQCVQPTEGNATCTCQPGTELKDGKCIDVDECATCAHDCAAKAVCINDDPAVSGSQYQCKCPKGLVGNPRTSCLPLTKKQLLAQMQHAGGVIRSKSFSQLAPHEMKPENERKYCERRREVPCSVHADIMTGGQAAERAIGYYCRCKAGYKGNGFSCVRDIPIPDRINNLKDRNERLDAKRDYTEEKDKKCVARLLYTMATVEEDGTPTCSCTMGLRYDPITRQCIDINECATCTHLCDHRAYCVNDDARSGHGDYPYRCVCLPGYSGNNENNERHKCTDINECINGNPCPEHTECMDRTRGSGFNCRCVPRWRGVDGSGVVDFNVTTHCEPSCVSMQLPPHASDVKYQCPYANRKDTQEWPIGTTATVSCEANYVPDSSVPAHCQAGSNGGKWDKPLVCVPTCPGSSLSRAIVTYSNPVYSEGTTMTVACTEHHTLQCKKGAHDTRTTATCTGGQWVWKNSVMPTCYSPCGAPHLENARPLRQTQSVYMCGEDTELVCAPGYVLDLGTGPSGVDRVTTVCGEGGHWGYSSPNPRCVPACTRTFKLDNGRVTFDGPKTSAYMPLGSKAKLECKPSYVLEGSAECTCRVSAHGATRTINWMCDVAPRCVAGCPMTFSVTGGRIGYRSVAGLLITYGLVEHRGTANVECQGGHHLNGMNQTRCNMGKWDGELGKCEQHCQRSLVLINGAISYGVQGQYIRNNGVAHLQCNTNYGLCGPDEAICVSGNWAYKRGGDTDKCIDTACIPYCPSLHGHDASVTVHYTGVLNCTKATTIEVGGTAMVTCTQSTAVLAEPDKQSIICVAPGMWSSQLSKCLTACTRLTLDNGRADYSKAVDSRGLSVAGTSAYITCNANYYMIGTGSLVCGDDGQWRGQKPVCVPTCLMPSLMHTVVAISKEVGHGGGHTGGVKGHGHGHKHYHCTPNCRVPKGTEITFTCKHGYVLSGPATVSCIELNMWSRQFPQCQAVCHASSVKVANGRVQSPNGGSQQMQVGQYVTIVCNAGFVISGPDRLTCMAAGHFDRQPPTCHSGCDKFTVANAKVTYSTLHAPLPVGAQATVTCNIGYTNQGQSHFAFCVDSKTWDPPPSSHKCTPACDLRQQNVQHGHFVRRHRRPNSAAHIVYKGDVLELVCDEGYLPTYGGRTTCVAPNKYDTTPRCYKWDHTVYPGFCYTATYDKLTFVQAEAMCREVLGGETVSLFGGLEFYRITHWLRTRVIVTNYCESSAAHKSANVFWMGIKDNANMDGSTLSFSHTCTSVSKREAFYGLALGQPKSAGAHAPAATKATGRPGRKVIRGGKLRPKRAVVEAVLHGGQTGGKVETYQHQRHMPAGGGQLRGCVTVDAGHCALAPTTCSHTARVLCKRPCMNAAEFAGKPATDWYWP